MSGASGMPEIAIVAMSGRFPDAPTVDALWRNSLAGTVSLTRSTPGELARSGVDPALSALPSYVPVKGFLPDTDLFDADAFGISPTEAELLDPQQRLFLEECASALDEAGIDPARFSGRIGTFAAQFMSTYLLDNLAAGTGAERDPIRIATAFQGNTVDQLALRVAYRLDLRGPAIGVQTACSSSLVAVHLAVAALLAGECDAAIAGGVAIRFPDRDGYLHAEGGIHSRQGACRPFDAAADGTVFGDGVAVVVLRRLDDALRDGDPIVATILATAVNNDGNRKAGHSAPSAAGQTEVLAEALSLAGVSADAVGHIEAHGTGTPIGDAVEFQAIDAVYGRRTTPLAVGSAKAAIGHLEAAAGITGLIRAAMAVGAGTVPPLAGLDAVNPLLGADEARFLFPKTAMPWPNPSGRRIAAVSAFGVGGTNAHAIIAEPPKLGAASASASTGVRAMPFPVTGRTEASLADFAGRLAAHLRATPDIDLAGFQKTLATGRHHAKVRRVAVASTASGLAATFAAMSRSMRREDMPEGGDSGSGEGLHEPAARLCAQWTTGGEIDWHGLVDPAARRLRLPPRSFERKRFFVKPKRRDTEGATPAIAGATILKPQFRTLDDDAVPIGGRQRRWLLVARDVETAAALSDHLLDRGQVVTTVVPGGALDRVKRGLYRLDMASADEWSVLMRDLRALVRTPGIVVDMMALGGGNAADLLAATAVMTGAWLGEATNEDLRLGIVAPPMTRVLGTETPSPAGAALRGLATVLGQEYRALKARFVDVEIAGGTMLGGRQAARIAGHLLADGPETAHLRGDRLFERVHVSCEATGGDTAELRRGGTYLVVGGTGGLGGIVARAVAERFEATVIVASRSAMAKASIVRAGAIVPMRCDVSVRSEVDALLAAVRSRHGPLHGIVLAAGVAGGVPCALASRADFAAALAPKAEAFDIVADAVEAAGMLGELDMITAFSSTATLLGGPGQGAYAAANAAMEAAVERRRAAWETIPHVPACLSILWDTVADTGMAKAIGSSETAGRSPLQALRDAVAIDPVDCADLFLRAIASGASEVVATRLPPSAFPAARAEIAAAFHAGSGRQHRPDLSTRFAAPAGELQLRLAGIWSSVLGTDGIGADDGFVELGGHSLLAAQLRAAVNQAFDVDMPIAAVFRDDTIARMAASIEALILAELADGEARHAVR